MVKLTMKFQAAPLLVCAAVLCVRAETTDEIVCNTPDCHRVSREILDRLSPDYLSMNACSDFDEMVCGGWRDKHHLRPDQFQLTTNMLMEEGIKASLRDAIEQEPYRGPSSAMDINFNKLKGSYEACMNIETLTDLGLKPLRELLENIDESRCIDDDLKILMSNGVTTLLSLEPHANFRNPISNILGVFAPPSLGLPSKRYYENEGIVDEYRRVIAGILGTLYPDIPESVSRKIVDIETQLAAFMPNDNHSKKAALEENAVSLSDAAQLIPQIDLEGLVKFFRPKHRAADHVAVHHIDYIRALSNILENSSSRVLKSYFRLQVAISYADYVQHDVFNDLHLLRRKVSAMEFVEPVPPHRWLTCINHLEKGLGWSLGRMFLYSSFSPADESFGSSMVQNIKSRFKFALKQSTWMDIDARIIAMQKIQNMEYDVGYPFRGKPSVKSGSEVYSYYRSVDVDDASYLRNERFMRKINIEKKWESLDVFSTGSQRGEAMTTPASTYYPTINRLVLTPALLQWPAFGVNIPDYISYGSTGFVIAREMSHTFDSLGRHYDHNAEFDSWWSEQTLQGFNNKAQCFDDEYSKLTVPNYPDGAININGTSTLEENISDFYGLSVAYNTWEKHSKGSAKNPLLPGLESFTQDQMFFVSFGSMSCSKSTAESTLHEAMTGVYTPLSLRKNAVVANSREFQKAFRCSVKEPVCEI
ncbi:Endothelin-converting enzyme 1 [Ceratocystis lukuohia]|uniref:Endothelin-converting enzyme 1 n=1 Tax=Ceratocystis lukuohia TaxID=2019550 RepID=A0ABR4MR17_9PEZI